MQDNMRPPQWHEPALPARAQMLAQLRELEPLYRFTPEDTRLLVLQLPFYDRAQLLRVDRALKGERPLWYVRLETGEIVALTGQAGNIAYLDAAAPVLLAGSAGHAAFAAAFGAGADNLPEDFTLPPAP